MSDSNLSSNSLVSELRQAHAEYAAGLTFPDQATSLQSQAADEIERLYGEVADSALGKVIIDRCDYGHQFAKLVDHPVRDGKPRCPHCLAIGFDSQRASSEPPVAKPSKKLTYLEWRLRDDPHQEQPWALYIVTGGNDAWHLLNAPTPLEVRGATAEPPVAEDSCKEPDPCVAQMALDGLQAAIGRLSMAMGNPAVHWDENSSLESAVIDEATRRLSEPPASVDIAIARNCLGNLYAAVQRFGPIDADIQFAMREAAQFLGPPYTSETKEVTAADPDEETPCPKREDGIHCECWYGGNPCCGCGREDILDGRAKPPCTAGETSNGLGPNGECPNCGGIEDCKPGCRDGSEIL